MSRLNVVILAAGLGKRMHSTLPKVLHPLAGKPLISHVLATARTLLPGKICVVYGYGGELVPQVINDDELIWVKQDPQMGTGHALLQTLPHLDSNGVTLVLYGDVPLTSVETLKKLIATSAESILALLTLELDDPSGYGRIVRSSEGHGVIAIVEEKDASESEHQICEINTGIMVVPNQFLHNWLPKLENKNSQKEYYLTDIVKMAVTDGVKVDATHPEHAWETLGINSKVQLAALERIYQDETAGRLLDQGVTLSDPSRINIRGQLFCGSDVSIDINCIFEGAVQLGDGVRVGANCILKNTKIQAGTQIAPFSLIEDAEIGKDCRIGPYARIRPGTHLSDEVHIGNFVEIKNSSISTGSKANHLSYIGDSIVGKNVNIGAGTITCNYDGANKHQTIIEDNVFIGSDTQLIAPVTVAKGATIGAGSTITKTAPPESLTLSRAKQMSISNWKRPVKK
ncbi:MAG: bifunctional UDP-N-acetylglucosamine diphosphorylase/glucosamine-1-phosphate N-acetyltransferase GlmU [Nitrosomonadaceae bacterium]|nr:bifunctional UDP-N-acetylglucosamine diphosphorylase/glucosamine-1-phosphate N-acetyltransferase GlmU [Nitrosomonadaceae bacterium]MDW7618286.1 bifunctional UDP-N-acetylglucosamine diphosphorylase/glucosamine-1-phosphate N-acetyltransferase GlmU [Nitrosomonadaceae bacterium]MDW7646930.1 bifunctional UDP-N-acetylglucosamine diphosphorylase/glucosamine-1-phosphate N-acetyltransferase GlmU [Nitrosomonadaceae bacterium]MDW7666298.1 bifunctional UDP-N-acetylglucosamine diphosphorylase/glucosamine-